MSRTGRAARCDTRTTAWRETLTEKNLHEATKTNWEAGADIKKVKENIAELIRRRTTGGGNQAKRAALNSWCPAVHAQGVGEARQGHASPRPGHRHSTRRSDWLTLLAIRRRSG